MYKIKAETLTKTICQLGFRCGQQSSQPATAASGFDRKATRNPQLHIVPSVIGNVRASPTDRQTTLDTQTTGWTRQTFLSL